MTGLVSLPVVEEVEDPITICRIYACIADVLGFMAEEGGIRGGPASNVSWRTAFALLEVRRRRRRRRRRRGEAVLCRTLSSASTKRLALCVDVCDPPLPLLPPPSLSSPPPPPPPLLPLSSPSPSLSPPCRKAITKQRPRPLR